ncbi:MAG TPA: hypothetical protein VNI54_17270 [Thermoanaerobaculia bacterium]|nr:hypothetical protein [Thermoanaerobaculia bacterium]
MLLFRDEEHVDRWCEQWHMSRGAVLSLETGWRLAQAWHGADRRDPEWRRRTVEETEALFASLGLAGDFWRLR